MEERSPYQKSCPEADKASLVLRASGGGCRARCAAAAELEAKLQRAVKFKTEGHRCYKQKKHHEAIGKYHRALLQLKGLEPLAGDGKAETAAAKGSSLVAWHRLSSEQREQADSTEIECYDNLTACLLQSELVKYERVREYCLRVLAKEKGNFKAMYRAGIAFYHLGDCDKALLCLKEAKCRQPTGGFWGGAGLGPSGKGPLRTTTALGALAPEPPLLLARPGLGKKGGRSRAPRQRGTREGASHPEQPSSPPPAAFSAHGPSPPNTNVLRYIQLTEMKISRCHQRAKEVTA